MSEYTFNFYYVPVGISDKVLDYISLIGDITDVFYGRTDCPVLFKTVNKPSTDTVHMTIVTEPKYSTSGMETFILDYLAMCKQRIEELEKSLKEVKDDNS